MATRAHAKPRPTTRPKTRAKTHRPTAVENQQTWERTYAPMLRRWRTAFSFLVEDHGFTATATVMPGECSLDLARGDAKVTVTMEYLDEPWVTVRIGSTASALTNTIAQLDPAYAAARPTGGDHAAIIRYDARFLADHVDELLPPPARRYTAAPRARPMTTKAEPTLTFATTSEWEAWLAKHHDQSSAVLLRIPKGKGSDLTYARALDAALAWGWIDSQKRALDATAWLQRFSPRTAKSPWSKINRARAEALIASGDMKQAGLDEVERARADGRWAGAYEGSRTAEVPADLSGALDRDPRARAFFDALDRANRYAILWRVQNAKKPETRARRIAQFVALCAAGKTLHPTRAKAGR